MNKLLLSYILTIGISAVAGGGTGIVLKRTVGPIDEMYPPGFDPSEYSPNVSEIMSRYDKLSDKSINGVKSFSDADIINIVLEKYRRQDYCWSIGIGSAFTIVTQTIRNAQIKYAGEYFEEQLSYSSVVDLAKRTLQHGVDGMLEIYDGSCQGPEISVYQDNAYSQTKAEYKDNLGKTLDEMFIYIISDKTVLDSSRTTKGDDTIIVFNLNPSLSTFYYKKQMMNISGLSNLPPFDEVLLTFTFSNEDLELKHLLVDETFTATKSGIPVPASTHNVIDNYYHVGEENKMEIPSYSERIDYSALLAQEE